MSLGGFYQRLLVAAGAVAFLVVNWFCKPARYRPPNAPQESQALETAPEQQALLEAREKEDIGDEGRESGEVSAGTLGYEAPELSPHDASEQLQDACAEVAPEEVVMEPALATSSASQRPSDWHAAEDVARQPTRSSAAAAARTTNTAPPPPRAEPASPIDEDYLKSFLDQELGPPKFAVRKPAPAVGEQQPPNSADDHSLQELLDQAFGPPRFAVPKSASSRGGVNDDSKAVPRTDPTPPPGLDSGAPPMAATPAPAAASSGSRAGTTPVAATAVGGVKRSAEQLEAEAAEEAKGLVFAGPPAVTTLTLSVTQGPASGKRVVAADPETEYKVGRLPDSWLQVLDQEVSGRHAAVRWDSGSGRWMLRDVGSLNGTALGGESIAREYKVPGEERPLSHGDCVTLGSVTQIRVDLAAAATEGAGAGAAAAASVGARAEAAAAAAAAPAKRHHSASFDGGGSDSVVSAGVNTDRSHQDTVAGLQALPSPGALMECPELGARLCVHNRLGVDHKRMSQGCEDVPHWELPFAPYEGAGIICVFDGHHGSRAAHQAKEHLPAILRAKLLRRDGRQAAPLPPPPPKPAPRKAEGEEEEEEEMMEAYDGASSEDVIEEEVEEGEGGEEKGFAARRGPGGDPGPGPGMRAASGPSGVDRNGGGGGGGGSPSGGEAVESEAAGADVPVELVPPPPEGPPLPPLLRGRDVASQRALLKDTFLLSDQYMSKEEGCTATLVMLERVEQQQQGGEGGWVLQSANVGDSSAVLVNFTRNSWFKLSEDHRIASSSSERERLARMGHTVRTRLYGLNISRMLGDRYLKEEDLGFLAEPYVGPSAQVGPSEHAVLIVASDGLWDVLPEERAATMLLQEAAKCASLHGGGGGGGGVSSSARPPGASRPSSTSSASSSFTGIGLAPPPAGPSASFSAPPPPSAPLGCQAVADMLLTRALQLRSKDDITISVLELGPHLDSRAAAAAGRS